MWEIGSKEDFEGIEVAEMWLWESQDEEDSDPKGTYWESVNVLQ